MSDIKFQLLFLLFIVIAIGLLYWAFTSLDTGQEIAVQEEEIIIPEEELPPPPEETEAEESLGGEVPTDSVGEPESDPEVEKLAADLEDLLDRDQVLEPGDSGLLVLRIQKFLNHHYPDLNLSEDQDFGPSTTRAVKKFQEDQGLTADGGIGPKTIQKMLDSLE